MLTAVQIDIVAASGERKNPTLVAEPVLDKLNKVSEQNFTVTALFCLFQSTKVVNSFKFVDFKGVNKTQTAASNEAANLLSSYFQALTDRCHVASTPNNPFVLGYGLTQELAAQTEEERRKAENVPYLVPKQFDLSVTKGDGNYSKGVINYCILTRRPQGVPEHDISVKEDPGAGFWQDGDTPFKRVRADGMSSGADGVMAFSRAVFRDMWLKEQFLKYFKVDTGELAKTLVPKGDNTAKAPGVSNMTESITVNAANKLTLKQDFTFHDMSCEEMNAQRMQETEQLSIFVKLVLQASALVPALELKYNQKRLAKGERLPGTYTFASLRHADNLTGYSEAILTYTSDVQQDSSIDKALDRQRRLKFDIELKSLVTITQQAAGICNINRLAEDSKSFLPPSLLKKAPGLWLNNPDWQNGGSSSGSHPRPLPTSS